MRRRFARARAHREGPDLDLLVEWCEPGAGVQALDVATGGGHVARRLREAGCDVVSLDPAPGMRPTVVARAEDIPFADGSFDVVACRIAPHHFDDVRAAVREMARVSRDRVVVEDNLFTSEAFEEAETAARPDPRPLLHGGGVADFFDETGLEVEDDRDVRALARRRAVARARRDCQGDDAARVRELLADRIEDGPRSCSARRAEGRKQ